MIIGIVGSGAMGTGITQVAAMAGHEVLLCDNNPVALERAAKSLQRILDRQVEKQRMGQEEVDAILSRIKYVSSILEFGACGLVIEAIIEDLSIKQAVFDQLEDAVSDGCILATNTSSLSVAAIVSSCRLPERVLGLHFFNPAPLMALVEIVPAVQTDPAIGQQAYKMMKDWGKQPVMAKDTPGFIVNRVARPFYGEALRIYEEGIADPATIDWAMKDLGGFRMGPFSLMDYIGHDVNYKVTETVFAAFYYDQRYRPSFAQKRLVEAGYLGRKSGKGFYDYADDATKPAPNQDEALGKKVLHRILAMLINEAADALYLGIASREDIDLAMHKGVNYPKGLLAWAEELGYDWVVAQLDGLYDLYREDRYRCSPWLRRKASA